MNNEEEPVIQINEDTKSPSVSIHYTDPAVLQYSISDSFVLELSISPNDKIDTTTTSNEADSSIDKELSGFRDQFNETVYNPEFSDGYIKYHRARTISNSSSLSTSSEQLDLNSAEKKERRRAKIFFPERELRPKKLPVGFYKETKSKFRPRSQKTHDSTSSDVIRIPVEIPPEDNEVFDETYQPAEMSHTQQEYEAVIAENARLKQRQKELEEINRKRLSLLPGADEAGTSQNSNNVSAAQLIDALEITNERMSESVAMQFAIHNKPNRSSAGGRDFVPQPTCITIPQRNFNLNVKQEEFEIGIPGSRSLLIIDEVEFSSTDNSASNKSIKVICEGARVTPWKASDDHRTVEEFLIEFENEIRQLVRTNKEYNLALDFFLSHAELLNYKKAIKFDGPWHENAIKLVKQFSTINNQQRDIRNFEKDKKKPQQSVVDFSTFWLRRMRWNTSVTAKWIVQVLLTKIGPEYREIFKECTASDTIEDIIEEIREMEDGGISNKKDMDASIYYHQAVKPLISKMKKSGSSSSTNDDSRSSSSNRTSSSSDNRSKKFNPFEKFDKGQIFKRTDRDGKARFKAVGSVNEIDMKEEGVSVCYVDANKNIKDYDVENPPNFDEEFECNEIEISIDDLNLN
ncbi:uncharacterized protein LOC135842430 [Planococcus citri]|uniref:uncharacterized protein LOC135842430 n=1 Tax=Planococcus citri TaxID=170843 RepID=UPI0031F9E1F6